MSSFVLELKVDVISSLKSNLHSADDELNEGDDGFKGTNTQNGRIKNQ